MKKYLVTLTKDERGALGELTSKGKHKSQKILNALILLGCGEGKFQKKRSTNELPRSKLRGINTFLLLIGNAASRGVLNPNR